MKRKARFQRTLASHGSFRRERSRERAGRSTGPLIIGRPLSVIAQRISISVGIFSGSIGLRVYWRGRRRKAKEWLFPGNSWHTSSRLVTTKVLWSARQIAAERAVLDNKCIHPTLCATIPRAGLCRVMGEAIALGPYFLIKMKMRRPTTRHSSGVSTGC